MKRIKLLLFIIITVVSGLSAYNYQTLYSHRVGLYSHANNEIQSLRIDSVKLDRDSILYPFKNIQEQGGGCYSPYGASWIGDRIVINQQWNYFFNLNGDTIKIKTDAKKQESWIVYNRSDLVIEATVQYHDTLTVFGVKDSVKTIGLTTHTTSGYSSFGQGTILLSKHFGLIKTYNFLHFPDYTNSGLFNNRLELYTLVGLTNPKAGIQNLTWFEVYDFQAGDEIHTWAKSQMFYPYFPNVYTETKTILKYLDRHDYGDSIVYQVDKTVGGNNSSVPYSHEVIRSVIHKDPEFDKLPGETVVSGNVAFAYTMNTDSFITKTRPSVDSEIWKQTDTCWRTPVADGCFPSFSYYKGLGGPYYLCIGLNDSAEETRLVYYKKGTTTHGSPLIISGFSYPEGHRLIGIYPNPTSDKIFVRNEIQSEPWLFELMNVQGVLLLRKEMAVNSNSMNLSGYANGLYLYRITLKNGLVQSGKIVKL